MQKIMQILWTVEYIVPKLIAASAIPLLVTVISRAGYTLGFAVYFIVVIKS